MHPVLLTVPGWLFKLVAPALMLWGLYSLGLAAFRRRRRVATEGGGGDDGALDALPGESPANALVALVLGVGLFLFTAPVPLGDARAAPFARAARALGAFARGVIDPGVWSARWSALPVYAYGAMLATSLVVGWVVSLRYATRAGLPRDRVADCFIVTALAAVAGSRVLYVLTNLHEFRDPATGRFVFAATLALRSGGLVAYGGFLGGLLASVLYCRRHRLAFFTWADAAVPSLATGLAITRVGCYLYGCDFGRPLAAGAPAVLRRLGSFPRWPDGSGAPAWEQHVRDGFRATEQACLERYHGDWHHGLCHLDPAHATSAPVHPTQLYESLLGAALAVVLVWLWRRRRFEGQVFLAFGALYGFARAALEVLRDDNERGAFAGMSTSQWIGIATGAACVGLYVSRRRRAPAGVAAVDLFARRAPPRADA